jgi:hypothetical protein
VNSGSPRAKALVRSVLGQPIHCQRPRESPGSGDDLSPDSLRFWVVAKTRTAAKDVPGDTREVLMTSPASGTDIGTALPDYAPVPRSALGPALNDQGYYVGRVERNLYWVTDGSYQSAFLTTKDGVVIFDAPPSIGNNIRRAVD